MERKIYTTPRTKLFSVELEGTFAGSIVKEDPESQVTITDQAVNEINGDDFTTGDNAWNNGKWE